MHAMQNLEAPTYILEGQLIVVEQRLNLNAVLYNKMWQTIGYVTVCVCVGVMT